MHKPWILSSTIIVCSFYAAGAEASRLCPRLSAQDSQEEVTRFAESDITAKAASEAISKLEMKRPESIESDGHHDHIVTGNLRLIEGYLLKYKAESDGTPDSIARFCEWLATYGHWPE